MTKLQGKFSGPDSFLELRARMVHDQIEKRGIENPLLLNIFRRTPRHLFVPTDEVLHAYEDRPLFIGDGQTISQPYIVALMTDSLSIEPTHRVLEIGTGSGYQTVILAQLAEEVLSIEINERLFGLARQRFSQYGFYNVRSICGDGWQGWKSESPFDRIIVTAAPPVIPSALLEQLGESGRLVIPYGESEDQKLYVISKKQGKISQAEIARVSFVPLKTN